MLALSDDRKVLRRQHQTLKPDLPQFPAVVAVPASRAPRKEFGLQKGSLCEEIDQQRHSFNELIKRFSLNEEDQGRRRVERLQQLVLHERYEYFQQGYPVLECYPELANPEGSYMLQDLGKARALYKHQKQTLAVKLSGQRRREHVKRQCCDTSALEPESEDALARQFASLNRSEVIERQRPSICLPRLHEGGSGSAFTQQLEHLNDFLGDFGIERRALTDQHARSNRARPSLFLRYRPSGSKDERLQTIREGRNSSELPSVIQSIDHAQSRRDKQNGSRSSNYPTESLQPVTIQLHTDNTPAIQYQQLQKSAGLLCNMRHHKSKKRELKERFLDAPAANSIHYPLPRKNQSYTKVYYNHGFNFDQLRDNQATMQPP